VAFAQEFTSRAPTWVVRDVEPAFALRSPEGFMRRNTEGAAYAMFTHPGRRAALMVFDMDQELAQGAALSASQRARLREADPVRFTDRDTTFRVMNFDVPGLRGVGTAENGPIVRFVALIPARGGTPAVFLIGPAEHEAELRRTLDATLATARSKTHWRTPWQRRVETLSGTGFLLALTAAVLYALLWFVRWRDAAPKDGPADPPSRLRVGLRSGIALGCALNSLWWLTRSEWMVRGMGVLLFLLGAQQALSALALWRQRVEAQGERETSAPRASA
jgi:hypothetical protein